MTPVGCKASQKAYLFGLLQTLGIAPFNIRGFSESCHTKQGSNKLVILYDDACWWMACSSLCRSNRMTDASEFWSVKRVIAVLRPLLCSSTRSSARACKRTLHCQQCNTKLQAWLNNATACRLTARDAQVKPNETVLAHFVWFITRCATYQLKLFCHACQDCYAANTWQDVCTWTESALLLEARFTFECAMLLTVHNEIDPAREVQL